MSIFVPVIVFGFVCCKKKKKCLMPNIIHFHTFLFTFSDYFIYKCNLKCSSVAHFHCVTCTSTFIRREWFIKHLERCEDRKTRRKLSEVVSGENPSQKGGPLSRASGVRGKDCVDISKTSAVQNPQDKQVMKYVDL